MIDAKHRIVLGQQGDLAGARLHAHSGDLSIISSEGWQGGFAISAAGAQLSAEGGLWVKAKKGAIDLADGILSAGGQLLVQAGERETQEIAQNETGEFVDADGNVVALDDWKQEKGDDAIIEEIKDDDDNVTGYRRVFVVGHGSIAATGARFSSGSNMNIEAIGGDITGANASFNAQNGSLYILATATGSKIDLQKSDFIAQTINIQGHSDSSLADSTFTAMSGDGLNIRIAQGALGMSNATIQTDAAAYITAKDNIVANALHAELGDLLYVKSSEGDISLSGADANADRHCDRCQASYRFRATGWLGGCATSCA